MKSIIIKGASHSGKSSTVYEVCEQLNPSKVYRLDLSEEKLIDGELKNIFNNTVSSPFSVHFKSRIFS